MTPEPATSYHRAALLACVPPVDTTIFKLNLRIGSRFNVKCYYQKFDINGSTYNISTRRLRTKREIKSSTKLRLDDEPRVTPHYTETGDGRELCSPVSSKSQVPFRKFSRFEINGVRTTSAVDAPPTDHCMRHSALYCACVGNGPSALSHCRPVSSALMAWSTGKRASEGDNDEH